jgi:predicted nucleic-acid-binding protein
VSSKNNIKKSDNYNDKAEQQALKEVEIVAELAPNEKTRKEAEELIETVENGSSSTVQEQEQEQEAIETVLDETKRGIKKTVNEAKREIPKYIKAIGDLQEGTIQATKEIGYDCIELQREAANLIPKLQERYLSYSVPWMSPTLVTEYYSRMVDNFMDNVVSATNLANNLAIVNMESLQRLADSTREYWRVGVENAKAISSSVREPIL